MEDKVNNSAGRIWGDDTGGDADLVPASILLVRKKPLKMKTDPANNTAAKENQRSRFDFFLRPPKCSRLGGALVLYGRSGASDLGTLGLSEGPVAPKL